MMRAKESITINASLLTVALFLVTTLLLPVPAWAVGEVFDAHHACAQDSGGVASCTSNEINIASASTAIADADVCIEGETVTLERIDVAFGLNTGLRYDPLLWVGIQGNDPMDTGGECYVSSAPSDAGDADSIFVDLEGSPGDSCLDILNPDLSEKPVSYVFQTEGINQVNVECKNFDGILDSNGNPDANVRAIITWLQNTNLSCGDKAGEIFSPGAPPKCDASVISLGIPFIPLAEQATLTLLKDVNNAGSGVNVDTDWTLNANGPVDRSGIEGEAMITAEVLPMGDYVLSESDGPGGYTASNWSCSGGSLNGNTLTLASGDVAVCTITNTFITTESLTITKVIQSDNGGGATLDDFDVSVDGGEIAWANPASSTGGTTLVTEQAGTYTLSELDTTGYSEGVWQCLDGDDIVQPVSNGGAFDGADVTVGLNQHVTCTITNNDIAPQLTIINHVINDNAGTAVASDWTMDVTATNPASNNFPGSETPGVTISIDAGAFSVNTSGGPAGYSQSVGAGCAGALAVGESSTCIITQDDVFIPPPAPPQLTLLKDVINDDGGDQLDTDWTLTATGPVVRSGIEGSAAVTAADVLAGVYTLSESGPAGYTASGWSCAGGSLSGDQLTLVDEDVAICSITNNDIAPTLTLTKQVINDEGGTAVADDFDISVGGAIVLSGSTNAYAANTPLAIDETLLADYIFVSISGDPRCPGALGGTVSLDEGEDLSCTITNNDIGPDPVIPPQLTLLKDVINDDGGDQLDTDWTLTATGPVVRSGIEGSAAVTAADVLAGVYTLSESGPAGYTASGWSCAGGSLSGDQLTLVDEDVAICTITNDDDIVVIPGNPPTLTLTKQVINDDGGTAGADDFGISVGGNVVLSGVINEYTANTPLAIDETLLAGYIFVSISGDAKCPDALGGTVSLNEGEDLSCTITNNDTGPCPGYPTVANAAEGCHQ